MRIPLRSWLWLPCVLAVSAVSSQAVYAQQPAPARITPANVGGVPVADLLQQLGAHLECGTSAEELDDYTGLFDNTDLDRDGEHTREEYVENGRYLTPQARAGIFRAADGDGDGVVSRAEYVLNRIITDEAKAIIQRMDDDEDGLVERAEFIEHSTKLLSNSELAGQVFAALDTDADGVIPVPEYLRVWGQWARTGQMSAEERIAAVEAATAGGEVQRAPAHCPACAMGLTAEFVFNRLDVNEDMFVTVTEFRRSPGMDDEEKAGEAVGRLDTSDDGKLSWEEFKTAYEARHANCEKPDPATLERNAVQLRPDGRGGGNRFAQVFILRSDQNNDGKIDESEFRGGAAGFQRLDKNENGFIEVDELGELHQRRLNDPRSMRQRLEEGDTRRPPQDQRPEDPANSEQNE